MENIVACHGPHCSTQNTTIVIMTDVILALIPAMIAAGIFFGYRALVLIFVCIIFCLLFEFIWCKYFKKPIVWDLSAAVTGILLALNLPPALPLWIAVTGCFISIIIIKQLFGGLGRNLVNPALAAKCVMLLCFHYYMTEWTVPFQALRLFRNSDLILSNTPLEIVRDGGRILPRISQLFLGGYPGCIGETSILALILGGVYLLIRKVIDIRIPLFYILSFCLTIFIFGDAYNDWLYQTFSGGLILGSVFMATDYVTTPLSNKGRIFFGIGCGCITALVRLRVNESTGGVMYAILFMNIIVHVIDYVKNWRNEKKISPGSLLK